MRRRQNVGLLLLAPFLLLFTAVIILVLPAVGEPKLSGTFLLIPFILPFPVFRMLKRLRKRAEQRDRSAFGVDDEYDSR